VVAGAAIQYLAQIFIDRHKQKAVLSDLRKEAGCNLAVVNDMLGEVGRFRTAAQPDTFPTYRWPYRAKDLLWIAFNQMLSSGQLYRIFTQREITEIQRLQQFLTPQMEDMYIVGQITQRKNDNNIPGAHQFADVLEGKIREGVAALNIIANKRWRGTPWAI
jgi:hypothetical protein